ncbi:hypothetical protein IM511_04875 [Erythrobacteraceae bacterium E2-1 Yellow Sea]|nr:hypothetical protein [Erythrobacteraceae bacterium E2-1 Yellow Sea]
MTREPGDRPKRVALARSREGQARKPYSSERRSGGWGRTDWDHVARALAHGPVWPCKRFAPASIALAREDDVK